MTDDGRVPRRDDPRFTIPDFQGPRTAIASRSDEDFRAFLMNLDDYIIRWGSPLKLTFSMKAALDGMQKERRLLVSLHKRLKGSQQELPAPPPEAEDSLFKEADVKGMFD